MYSKLLKHAATASSPGGSTGPGKANGKGRMFETSSITTGGATIVQDHGYSGWIDFHPTSRIKLELGYSHSISYALNTIFFSAGFDIGSLLSRTNR